MLRAVLLQPDRQYRSSELIAISGPGYGAGKRLLDEFEQSGIVRTTRKGNYLLFCANVHHPIYPELLAICRKTFAIDDTVAKALMSFNDRIELAFVFGSVAAEKERTDSDLDLMIVGSLTMLELEPALKRLSETIGREIDCNLHTPEEWYLLQDDKVVRAILREKRIVVIDALTQRPMR